MRSDPINLLGGSNVDSNVTWSTEDTVNYFIEKASSDGFLTPLELRDAPGLKPYVIGPTTGGGESPVIPAGPVRGSHDCEGKQFHVMGSTLYQISNAGIAIPLGTVPGTQRVNMAHNQIVGGNEVIITTGTPNGYAYNTVTQVFGRITDPGYPGGGSVDYIDTYLVSVEPFGRYWFWSDQASATSYNTLNRTEAEADPDSIVALAVNAFEVVVFGQQTVEFFYNAGGINGSTFRSKKVMNNHGCAARDSVVKLDNSLFWLGVDGIIYRLNGYQAMPVSTPQFTQRIQGKNWGKAYAHAFEDQGHSAYIITFTDGETFVYDVPVQATTRLESCGLSRWRASTLIRSGRRWVAGDFQAGKLYELDWNYPMDGEGVPLVRERISGVMAANRSKLEVPLVELIFGTGGPEIEPVMFVEQPDPPTIAGDAPGGTIGTPYVGYAYTLTGNAPLKVTLRFGTLPPGLVISQSGAISGTPTELGNYPFTLRVTDVNGLWAELDDEIPVATLMMAMGRLPPPEAGDNASFIPSTSGTDWSTPPSAVGVAPNGNQQLVGGTDRFFCYTGAVPSYTTDIGENWIASTGSLDNATGGVGVYHKGLFIVPGTVAGYYQSDDQAASFTLRAEPTYPRSQYFAENGERLAVFSAYYNTIHYCDDADAATPIWTQTVAHGITTHAGRGAFGGDGVIKFTGSIASVPVVKRLNEDGSLVSETLPTFVSATAGTAICFMTASNGDKIWALGTDSGELAYKVNGNPWALSADSMSVSCVDAMTNGAVIVMLGDGAGSSDAEIKYSDNGEDWTNAPLDTPMSLFSVAALMP
jgi:hypothetical protein